MDGIGGGRVVDSDPCYILCERCQHGNNFGDLLFAGLLTSPFGNVQWN
jgi:hypothetical protein